MPVSVGSVAIFLGCVVLTPRAMAAAQDADASDSLLAKAGGYVAATQTELERVVSDEWYRQKLGVSGSRPRTIRAEMLFWWIPEERVWLSVRNVTEVDGRPVSDSHQRLERALDESAAPASAPVDGRPAGPSERVVVSRSARLRALQDEARRYDLVPERTIANPTLVLQFLLPENREHFSIFRDRIERVAGMSAWKFNFTEHGGSTVVTMDGVPVASSGSIWIRETDGSVLRTRLMLRAPTLMKTSPQRDVEVTVDFRREPKLGVQVPTRMDERSGNLYCRSTYTNFRRFETSGRVTSPSESLLKGVMP